MEYPQAERIALALERIADALEEANRQPAFEVDLTDVADSIFQELNHGNAQP